MDGFDRRTPLRHPESAASPEGPGASLARIVEQQVIPRLLRSRGSSMTRTGAHAGATEAHVETLTRLALSRDPAAAYAQIASLQRSGMRPGTVLETLIAPAARRLGDMWREDTANFMDVALACGRLATIVRRIDLEIEPHVDPAAPLALVTTLEGERHGLGAMVLSHHLRSSGWAVCEAPGASGAALCGLTEATRWDMIAISVGDTRRLDAARECVRVLRTSTARGGAQRAVIAVGGPALMNDPRFAEKIGADFGAVDAGEAVEKAAAHLPADAPAARRAAVA